MKNFKLSEMRVYWDCRFFHIHPSIQSISYFFHLCAWRHKTLFFPLHASLFYVCCCCCHCCCYLFHSSKYKWYRFINWGLQSKCLIIHGKKSERASGRTYTNSKFEWWILQLNANLNRFIGTHSTHTHTHNLYYIFPLFDGRKYTGKIKFNSHFNWQ